MSVQSIPQSYTTIRADTQEYQPLAYLHQNAVPYTRPSYIYPTYNNNSYSYQPLAYLNQSHQESQVPQENQEQAKEQQAKEQQAKEREQQQVTTILPHTIYYVNNIPHVCYAHQPDILYPM